MNAALAYAADAYQTGGPRLMGAQAASEAFLKAWIRYSGVERYYAYANSPAHFRSFQERLVALGGSAAACVWIPMDQAPRLAEVGCLYHPDAFINDSAWLRRLGDERGYSICGVTHTTCTDNMLDLMGDWSLAPTQPWDAVICTSASVLATVTHVFDNWEAYLRERLGATRFTRPQLPVIPLGVDAERFSDRAKCASQRRVLRAALGIGASDVVFLFFGRLSFHAKAHPLPMFLALEAAAQRTGKQLRLILAGWFANEAIEKVFRAGAAKFCPSVKLHIVDGRKAEVREQIWHAADIFTSLSDNIQETFGLTPIEAMSAGLPLVISDWDGYRDTVRHGVDGFLVPTIMPPAGCGEEFAARYAAKVDPYDRYIAQQSQCTAVDIPLCTDYYVQLIESPELRAQLGNAGRQRAEAAFSWRGVIGAYQTLWRELAERRAAAPMSKPLSGPRLPLREDPLALFANYPTRALTGAVLLELASPPAVQQLPLFYADPLANYVGAPVMLATQAECAALLAELARGQRSVAELTSGFASERASVIVRSLGWLLKIGLVRLSR
ncbi:MAG TPA: glycosyltransferase family 4 protein [Pirellulaceae bacterium]|nr:glycosyltransferase family 4 protein [Pirellulaceae bacterium]